MVCVPSEVKIMPKCRNGHNIRVSEISFPVRGEAFYGTLANLRLNHPRLALAGRGFFLLPAHRRSMPTGVHPLKGTGAMGNDINAANVFLPNP